MRKFICILFLIICFGSIINSCSTIRGHSYFKENIKSHPNRDHMPIYNKAYDDVRVYWEDIGPCLLTDRYLILKPTQGTYEYYSEWNHISEFGTYEQKKDTLYLTPQLLYRNGAGYEKWDYREMPNTDTTIFVADYYNINKTFLVKDDGEYLIDLTTYYPENIKGERVPHTDPFKYVFICNNYKAKITPLGKK